jgi:WD40 repeat protein
LEAAHRLAEEQQRRANEQSQNAKRLRRRAMFLAGALISAIVMASAALFFGEQARQSAIDAQTASRIATSREFAAAALSNLNVDPERSILLALQAVSTTYSVDQTVLPEAEDALHRAVLASRARLTLSGHTAQLVTVAYSPDGTRLATASQDGTAKVWDAITGKLLLTLREGHTDSVNGLAYSPDGKRIATANNDHTAVVFDAETGRELLILSVILAGSQIAYSPDGMRIVTSSSDDTAKMWMLRQVKNCSLCPKAVMPTI